MNQKRIVMLGTAGIVTASTLCYSLSCSAASQAEYIKDENVYVRMENDGEVLGTYVVNGFTVTDAGEITDYGDYETVKNLTDLNEIEKDKDEYTIYADKGKFYYQGDIKNAELPWNFEIEYELDGKSIDPEDLAGERGDLELTIKVRKNDDVHTSDFFDNYMLQTAVTLDNDLCEDIEAEGATIVDTGSSEKLTFTFMPGRDQVSDKERQGEENLTEEESNDKEKESDSSAKDDSEGQESTDAEDNAESEEDADEEGDEKEDDVVASYVVKASVEDFEMDDITINGAPMMPLEKSFASADNENTRQTMFIMSIEGIEIEEEEAAEIETTENKGNFIQQIIDRFKNRNI